MPESKFKTFEDALVDYADHPNDGDINFASNLLQTIPDFYIRQTVQAGKPILKPEAIEYFSSQIMQEHWQEIKKALQKAASQEKNKTDHGHTMSMMLVDSFVMAVESSVRRSYLFGNKDFLNLFGELDEQSQSKLQNEIVDQINNEIQAFLKTCNAEENNKLLTHILEKISEEYHEYDGDDLKEYFSAQKVKEIIKAAVSSFTEEFEIKPTKPMDFFQFAKECVARDLAIILAGVVAEYDRKNHAYSGKSIVKKNAIGSIRISYEQLMEKIDKTDMASMKDSVEKLFADLKTKLQTVVGASQERKNIAVRFLGKPTRVEAAAQQAIQDIYKLKTEILNDIEKFNQAQNSSISVPAAEAPRR